MIPKLVGKAFKKLLSDKDIHSVTIFEPTRVKVTRAKNGNGYHVDMGKPNYSERIFLKKHKKDKNPPKMFTKYFGRTK